MAGLGHIDTALKLQQPSSNVNFSCSISSWKSKLKFHHSAIAGNSLCIPK